MKKRILLAIIASVFCLHAHADYDPLDDPNSPQFKKAAAAEQARAAKKKANTDRKLRDARVQALRKDMGKDAIGKSDAEVEAMMKALTGSGTADVANMSPKERDAVTKEMEEKYGGK